MIRALYTCCLLCLTVGAAAEQMVPLGEAEVHYSVVPTTVIKPEIAARNDLVRARDRALVNVSVIGPDGLPVNATVSGTAKNLLSQVVKIEFREVHDGTATYHLATVRHTDNELLRFEFHVTLANGIATTVRHQQQMHWDE